MICLCYFQHVSFHLTFFLSIDTHLTQNLYEPIKTYYQILNHLFGMHPDAEHTQITYFLRVARLIRLDIHVLGCQPLDK